MIKVLGWVEVFTERRRFKGEGHNLSAETFAQSSQPFVAPQAAAAAVGGDKDTVLVKNLQVCLSLGLILGLSLGRSLGLSLRFEGLFLYTSGVLFNAERCIRLSAMIFVYHVYNPNLTRIAYPLTNISPLQNIKI